MIRVDRSHPLSRGMLAWAMGLPGRFGGASMTDLIAGTKLPFSASWQGNSPSWSSGPAQGPGPAIQFPFSDATFGHPAGIVDVGYSLASKVSNALTIAVYAYTPNSATLECFCGEGVNPPDTDVATVFRLPDHSYWARVSNTTNTQATVSGGAWPTGRWTSVILTYDGSTVALYADGVSLGTAALTGSVYATGLNYAIGARAASSDYRIYGNGGKVAAWLLWNRGLSASEAAQVAAEMRAGYPNLLRRDRTPVGLLLPSQAFRPWYSPAYSGFLGTGAA